MLKIKIFTLYPGVFPGLLDSGLYKKAREKKIWDLEIINIREFGIERHRTVDDTTFGGGNGMLMRADVLSTALDKKIDGNQVVCKVQRRLDRYKRYIGVCFVGEVNLNKWMVRNGYAVAYRRYSKDYIQDENYAKKNNLGLWSGNFINPEKWRKLN